MEENPYKAPLADDAAGLPKPYPPKQWPSWFFLWTLGGGMMALCASIYYCNAVPYWAHAIGIVGGTIIGAGIGKMLDRSDDRERAKHKAKQLA